MSLTDEERTIIVDLEIEKAQQAYQETLWLMEKKAWSGAAGRLYYALFHIVSALLIKDHHPVNSHKGSHVLFSGLYIKTGRLSKEYGTLYGQMEAMRESAEYNCTYNVTESDLKSRLEPSKKMIDDIIKLISENS